MNSLILTCVLMVTTPHGDICIKPNGEVTYPKTVSLDQVSKDFWAELAKQYPFSDAKSQCEQPIADARSRP